LRPAAEDLFAARTAASLLRIHNANEVELGQ
jgi:hypothetical protein